jgi:hypothetical protein
MARGRNAITGFTAGRPLVLAGTAYATGAAIPTAVVARLHNASTLLSRRWIVPANAVYPKKYSAGRLKKPAPLYQNPSERRNLGA